MSISACENGPKIVRRDETVLSPWVTLVTKTVSLPNRPPDAIYHALKQADYISILAITADQRIPMVRQYRPALERVTLELPGGLLEPGELPADAIARELREETGYLAVNGVHLLGCLAADVGRMENRLWCYIALDVVPHETASAILDEGIEVVSITFPELRQALSEGRFEHSMHVALLGLAVMQGFVSPSLLAVTPP